MGRIDIAVEHQISLLEKYYDVDKEKKEINVKSFAYLAGIGRTLD